MRGAIDHPLFGILMLDDWGEHVTLRKFPFLPEFARSDRDPADDDLPLIADWQRHIPTLAPRAREFPLRGGLHREGVFEVYVEFTKDEMPSAAHTAAFAAFAADEERVCRNLVAAMLRHYRASRREIPGWFNDPEGVEFPDDPDPAALARILEYDCLTVPRSWAVAGVSPLIFSWSPAWDEEHGLRSLVYGGEVLMVGTGEVDDMAYWPSDKCFSLAWNRSVMTAAETAAFDAYCRAHAEAGKDAQARS